MVELGFSVSCAYPDTYNDELCFNETTHNHYISVKVPANYASDEELLDNYVREILYNSGADHASTSLYHAEICVNK